MPLGDGLSDRCRTDAWLRSGVARGVLIGLG